MDLREQQTYNRILKVSVAVTLPGILMTGSRAKDFLPITSTGLKRGAPSRSPLNKPNRVHQCLFLR